MVDYYALLTTDKYNVNKTSLVLLLQNLLNDPDLSDEEKNKIATLLARVQIIL